MRLVEYEELIKSQIKDNRRNPEIYTNLQKMIEMFLRRKKVCKTTKDYQDMSYLLAGDIFMKIINGEDISYYLGYLEKVYRKYAHQYYKDNSSEIIEYDDSTNVEELLYGYRSSYAYEYIGNKLYLENIGKVIDQIMYQSCKYDPESSAFNNLKLSLILSILRNQEVSFHLNHEQTFYLKMILTNFYDKILKDVKM